MGTVYRARDRQLRRFVAVKLLRRKSAHALRRFVVEAQVAAQLEHPNILPFYGLVMNEHGTPGQALRLIEGESLSDYLAECGDSPERCKQPAYNVGARLEIFLKVCDAIDYAHARAVVHRDLKPSNVMLGLHNEVYVTDWGVAKVLSAMVESPVLSDTIETGAPDFEEAAFSDTYPPPSSSASPLSKDTIAGDIVGSLAYMSPEQARGRRITPAADQYALGLMLQELFTLSPAREGVLAATQLTKAITNERLPFVHRFGFPIPPAAAAIVARATATEPGDRYPDVRAFAADVRRLARDEEVSVHPDSRFQAAWRWLKKRPHIVVAMILGLVLFGAAAIMANLHTELADRERAAQQSERASALAVTVSDTARALEARFSDTEDLVTGLGSALIEINRAPPSTMAHAYTTKEFALEVVPTEWSDRYSQRITFEHPVTVVAPSATKRDVSAPLLRIFDIERVLIQAAARSAGTEAVGELRETRIARARAGARIMWSAVGFESGLLTIYPGSSFFPDDYDVRKRAWYRAAASARDKVWGEPYPGASSGSLNVSYSMPLLDADGKFFGVAAALVAIEDLLPDIRVSVDGYRSSAILNARGDIVFTTDSKVFKIQPGTHENRKVELAPFPVPAVRYAAAHGARQGRIVDGDLLVTFVRLSALGWTLAVTTDRAPYEFR
jgi:serine/threonine-protein kinase